MRTRTDFLTEFALFGPEFPPRAPFDASRITPADYPFLQLDDPPTRRAPTLDEALDYCRRLTRAHYENFAVDSPATPRRLRTAFRVAYSYCRWADDLGDELDDDATALAALDAWEAETNAAFERARSPQFAPSTQTSSTPQTTLLSSSSQTSDAPQTSDFRQTTQARQAPPFAHPVFIALTELFRRFPNLSREPFVDLLTAFRLDRRKRNWASLAELEDYCRYSANPVGRIVLALTLDAPPTPFQLERSDAICSGLQLANFWQDVARDAEIGRDYIPEDVRRRNGGDFQATLRELVAAARTKFAFGRPLLATLPFRLRVVIALFVEGGTAILDAIERAGFRTDVRRPSLSKARKFAVLLKSVAVAVSTRRNAPPDFGAPR